MEFVSETPAAAIEASDATATATAATEVSTPVKKAALIDWVDDKSSSDEEDDKNSDDSSSSSSVRLLPTSLR